MIAWQRKFGRHHLPWQKQTDPYRVWLSEIMLQQTQVATVIPYYNKFLGSFPDVVSLADAGSEEVMSHWSGLGYYSRARNLPRCAQQVRDEYGGTFPADTNRLEQLPGIGRSTAAAIAVFAFGQREAIMDGNVKRVFARHFGVNGEIQAAATINSLWSIADRELAVSDPVAYTQGMMDLGATCCTRSSPQCEDCPVSAGCVALKTGRVSELPRRRKRKALQTRRCTMLLVTQGKGPDARIVVFQRPGDGIWPGLLSLPESSLPAQASIAEHLGSLSSEGLINRVADVAATDPPGASRLATVQHAFTHFKLQIDPVVVPVQALSLSEPARWLAFSDVADAPLPAPVKKLLLSMRTDVAAAGS